MNLLKIVLDNLPPADADKFIMVLTQHEIDLIGVALEQFKCDLIFDANIRTDCDILVTSIWKQQQIINQKTQPEQDQDENGRLTV